MKDDIQTVSVLIGLTQVSIPYNEHEIVLFIGDKTVTGEGFIKPQITIRDPEGLDVTRMYVDTQLGKRPIAPTGENLVMMMDLVDQISIPSLSSDDG